MVKWLHGKGAKIAPVDDRGAHPLHLACLAGKQSTARWLLFYGADADAKTVDGMT